VGGFPAIDPTSRKILARWVNLPDPSRYETLRARGAAGGYATLDGNGQIDIAQIDIAELRKALGLP
jgi:hypothetical protein